MNDKYQAYLALFSIPEETTNEKTESNRGLQTRTINIGDGRKLLEGGPPTEHNAVTNKTKKKSNVAANNVRPATMATATGLSPIRSPN